MEGVFNAEGDIETLKAYLHSILAHRMARGDRVVGNLLFPAATALERHARDT